MKRLLSLLVLFFSVVNIMAQPAQMLDKNISGIGCSFNVAEQSGIRQSGFALGYSHKGQAGISAMYAMSFMNYSRIGALRNSTTGSYTGLEADYWPFRKEFGSFLYFKTGVVAGIGKGKFEGLTFWDNETHTYYTVSSNRDLYGGVESLLNIRIFEHFIVQPLISVVYCRGTEWYTKYKYLGSHQNYDDLFITGSLSVGYKTKMGATIGLGITKNIISFDNTKSLSAELEIALPL